MGPGAPNPIVRTLDGFAPWRAFGKPLDWVTIQSGTTNAIALRHFRDAIQSSGLYLQGGQYCSEDDIVVRKVASVGDEKLNTVYVWSAGGTIDQPHESGGTLRSTWTVTFASTFETPRIDSDTILLNAALSRREFYRNSARSELREVIADRARHQLDVAKVGYDRKKDDHNMRLRLNEIRDQFPGTDAADDATQLLLTLKK